MTESRARYGWESDFPEFSDTQAKVIRERLSAFISDASPEQRRAWDESIPPLQHEVLEVLRRTATARDYSAILEYELPLESRRPDVILLVSAGILVVELKGYATASQAAIDQVAAYARDLKNYHRECHERDVVPVLVPTRARGHVARVGDVHVVGPDALDAVVASFVADRSGPAPSRAAFLSEDAYCPLPTLVEAARELFHTHELRTIKRARSETEGAIDKISRVIHQAAYTKSRHLILLTGVPGAGKTLVGLQTVHAKYLDDLALARGAGRPTAPAVFLSGNGPLVEVLQYELRRAGGDGKTFVRGVKDYIKAHSGRGKKVPNEHVLVFDEAQRAFDREMMAIKHPDQPTRSEPEAFIEFADRVPEWSVVLGLIGSGQEIHVGEEGGIGQWYEAVAKSTKGDWTVHGPASVLEAFAKLPEYQAGAVPVQVDASLTLNTELRFHAASDLHKWVAGLIAQEPAESLARIAQQLERDGLHLRVTRSLDVAKSYARERYREDPTARFGLLASSKDKALERFGVPNGYQATKQVKMGPWYGDAESDYGRHSCRHLESCVTEFGAQGLELDLSLVAWGTDFMWTGTDWSNARASGYKLKTLVRDAKELRRNAYRVLLTRGRDATVVFVPPLPELNATYDRLIAAGMSVLVDDTEAYVRATAQQHP